MPEPLKVVAIWDPDALVWVAESDDIPGLITEAATVEAMMAKLAAIVPVLLEENDFEDARLELPIELTTLSTQSIRRQRVA